MSEYITPEELLDADIDRFITIAGNFGIDEALEFWKARRGDIPPPFTYEDMLAQDEDPGGP